MKKVLLVSMPFGALERPALGLSLLKAELQRVEIDCDVRYLSFEFANFIGVEDYQWLASGLPYIAFAGDWSFTGALYGSRPDADASYIAEVLCKTWRIDGAAITRLKRIRSLVPQFLSYCLSSIQWQDYATVGFTSTFEQNIPSLALAKRIKAACPGVPIVFGGANWEGEMGEELHRQFRFVDYVCSGEADESFPALARLLINRSTGANTEDYPAGIVWRKDGRTISTGRALPVRNMDALPIPDFGDYFEQWSRSSATLTVSPTVLVETSRGCWWGDKSHCTFCGLNGANMTFRSKSAERALTELCHLSDRWQTDRIEVVDNILDMKYFTSLLPRLAQAGRKWEIFYEVKANLTRQQVAALRAAGINRIQPGIESLNDHVLKLMRKGTTGLRNVQLLKWCREYGVAVDWNILYGFPGETREDYVRMLEILPAIRFLQPPAACGPIRLDRFSPYFESPQSFGLKNVRPIRPYSFLYPFAPADLMKIAYYFDFDYKAEVDPAGCAAELIELAEAWRQRPDGGMLCSTRQANGTLLIHDTRAVAAAREFALADMEQAVYEFCDEVRPFAAVLRHLGEKWPQVECPPAAVQKFLDSLEANCLMLREGDNYLSLAIRMPAAAGEHSPPLYGLREMPYPAEMAGTVAGLVVA